VNAIADIFDKAADLIEANGLHKGEATPGHATASTAAQQAILAGAPCCTVGALFTASPQSGAYRAFRRWLSDSVGPIDIITWNDAPERTQQEVVTALREAAEAHR